MDQEGVVTLWGPPTSDQRRFRIGTRAFKSSNQFVISVIDVRGSVGSITRNFRPSGETSNSRR
jgi:hypothetical protein